jgi:acylphosphatase
MLSFTQNIDHLFLKFQSKHELFICAGVVGVALSLTNWSRAGLNLLPRLGFLWQITTAFVNRRRMQILYSGSVQGVGFRFTVKSTAMGFDVAGLVRNLPDGRVELVAEGQKPELDAFRQAIRDSGLEHFIRDENVAWAEPKNEFRGFEIAR